MTTEDSDLLRRFVQERADDAFTELVRRRIDLVYAVALRQVGGDAHLAQDVTQKVFLDLARKASTLLGRPVLSGWLYRSAQYAASDVVRGERRRRAREQRSSAMHELNSPAEPATDWDRLRPILDQALGELGDTERDAIALRFFEGRAFADVGRALQLTEEAARKRVERALDKLAAILARHGVTSTSAAIGLALAQPALAAPAGLATSVAGSALAGTAAGATSGLLLLMGSTKFGVVAGVIAAAAAGGIVYQTSVVRQRDAETSTLRQRAEQLQASVRNLEQRLQQAEQRARAAEEDNAKLLSAVQRQSAARIDPAARPAAANEPITHDAVELRYRRAQELARSGDPDEALRELLWCFDEGMVRVTGYGGVRTSFLLAEIARLGERHPPALAALRERRDAAEKRLLASATDFEATSTFGAINRTLREPQRTLAVFEQLAPGDRRRSTLASAAIDELIAGQRYREALEARNYNQMVSFFTSVKDRPGGPAGREAELRRSTVNYHARNVEILAGSGDLTGARSFAKLLLDYDNTPATRALIVERATRAGHPELLDAPGSR